MAILAKQKLTKTGLNPVFVAAAGGGDSFPSSQSNREYVEVINGGVGEIDVTIVAQQPCGVFGVSSAAHDLVVPVPAGERRKILVPGQGYLDVNGRVQITYEGVTSVTVGVFE